MIFIFITVIITIIMRLSQHIPQLDFGPVKSRIGNSLGCTLGGREGGKGGTARENGREREGGGEGGREGGRGGRGGRGAGKQQHTNLLFTKFQALNPKPQTEPSKPCARQASSHAGELGLTGNTPRGIACIITPRLYI